MPDDPFHLARFIAAQERDYARARAELAAGRKTSHWIWYVFPQMKGLGHSVMSERYGIGSLAEARAYLAHPVLGPRLAEATGLMLTHRVRPLGEILGPPDDLKFRSSMTLFAAASPPGGVYAEALAAFCDGNADHRTLALLGRGD
jgi:uncharacterized protein (DUF1810 family)